MPGRRFWPGAGLQVMLLLSPAIDKKTIRWKEHLKGRLIQASFSWHGARVHVLIAYQHVWSSQKSVHQNKDHLAKLLGSLASALRAIPARDTLLLAGDFNAQLHASQNLVGRSSTPKENTGSGMNPFNDLWNPTDWWRSTLGAVAVVTPTCKASHAHK